MSYKTADQPRRCRRCGSRADAVIRVREGDRPLPLCDAHLQGVWAATPVIHSLTVLGSVSMPHGSAWLEPGGTP
jgi:hypothetical protein